MEDLLKLIETHGLMMIVSVLFLYAVFHAYKELSPKLDNIDKNIEHFGRTEETLRSLVNGQHEAMEQVARTNENVAHSLDLLRVTLDGMYDDVKEMKICLHRHDSFSEKIYTTEMVNRELNKAILTHLTTPKEAEASLKQARYEVKEKIERFHQQNGEMKI